MNLKRAESAKIQASTKVGSEPSPLFRVERGGCCLVRERSAEIFSQVALDAVAKACIESLKCVNCRISGRVHWATLSRKSVPCGDFTVCLISKWK